MDTIADLRARRCVPCEGGAEPLSPERVAEYLATLPNWRLMEDGLRIRRDLRARNFVAALDYLRRIGDVAEREGHHPDLALTRYRHVSIELWTHAVNGLTMNDFVLAAHIDAIPIDATAPAAAAAAASSAASTAAATGAP